MVNTSLAKLARKIDQLQSQELLIRQAVIVINEQGIIEGFNPGAERMFRYAAAEVMGTKVNRLMPEPFASEHDGYLANYVRTGRAKVIDIGREVMGLCKDGSTFPAELAVNEMRIGDQRKFIGMVRALSDRRARAAPEIGLEKTHTVRVASLALDEMFDLVGEVIITRNRIMTMLGNEIRKDLRGALATLSRLLNELQEKVSAARLVPVDEIFQKFPRLVRELGRERGKEADLVLTGRHIELDKGVLDLVSEPLIHLIRNALDHGLESSEERLRRKKSRRGTISLSARRSENHIFIEVADDGGGIDFGRLKQVLAAKQLMPAGEIDALKEGDLLKLIFRPGVTSVASATPVSGRGVGLDVVKKTAEQLGGNVEVATRPGEGTRFSLRLPLATAIMHTLMVGLGSQVFAVPSDLVMETLEVKPEAIRGIGSNRVIIIRGQTLPFMTLNEILDYPEPVERVNYIVLVIRRGDRLMTLGVDTVLDQMESIVKPLDPLGQKLRGFSGATILGDGRVALLLDLPALLQFETAAC